MGRQTVPAAQLCLRVSERHEVAFVPFPNRSPLFVVGAGSTRVSLTLPDELSPAHVEFARHLASQAWAYAVAVERRYRGLPPLPDAPVPYWPTAKADALLDGQVAPADQAMTA
jgi:hypothetical protein